MSESEELRKGPPKGLKNLASITTAIKNGTNSNIDVKKILGPDTIAELDEMYSMVPTIDTKTLHNDFEAIPKI